MAGKITDLTAIGSIDRTADLLEIVDISANASNKVTVNNMLGITGNPVGTSDIQTMTNKTLTAPTITSPILSGTITGTYTLAGTPTFPSSVVTLTGSQTLTNKILTSPTLSAPTITNASITADTISGFTTSNSGTIYGIAVTAGKLSGANLTNQTVGPNQLATGAQAAVVTTAETSSSTSYVDLATVTDTVTVTIGANGLALVILSATLVNNTTATSTYMSFAASGANTIASSDARAFISGAVSGLVQGQGSWGYLATGLATGSTTFKAKYRVSAGGGTFSNRNISVIPL